MLYIGQKVYCISRIKTGYSASYLYRTHVAEKAINALKQEEDGTITYMAGKHGDLIFRENSSGQYQTVDGLKIVYLDREAAEKEWSVRNEQEKRCVAQQMFIDKVADSIGCVPFRPDSQDDCASKNIVQMFLPDEIRCDSCKGHVLGQNGRRKAVNSEPAAEAKAESSSIYCDSFWTFENTDRFGRISYEFANRGQLDLRGPNWQTIVEGSMKLAYYERIQSLYVIGWGGYAALKEADETYNDLNRRIINAFFKANGVAYLGKINLSAEKRKRIAVGTDCVLEEYTGQRVYNFGCEFVVPVADKMLEQLILDWNGIGLSHGQPSIEKIIDTVERLGGRQFLWY